MSRSRRLVRGALVLLAAAPGWAADAILDVPAPVRGELRAAAQNWAPLSLRDFALQPGLTVTLNLEPFQVFAPDAEIVEVSRQGERELAAPDDVYFRGTVAGDSSSLVVLALGRTLRGLVFLGHEVFAVAPLDNAYGTMLGEEESFVRRIDREREVPANAGGWRCETDGLPHLATFEMNGLAPRSAQTLATSTIYRAKLAIDTDYELYQMLGSSAAVTRYVGDLVAAGSAIYRRDVRSFLQVGTLYIYTTASDPWTATDTMSALFELGDYWHSNRSGVSRATVHHLCGRDMGGGIAWVEVICDPDFGYGGHWGGGYGLTASLNGQFSLTNPNLYWDIMAFTHELGHNFSSPHTHCYDPPVDICFNEEEGCYDDDETGVPPEKGTIMSYCHLRSGGYSNIKLFLGVPGETSEAVTDQIRPYIESRAACLGKKGVDTIGIYRDTDRQWYLKNTNTSGSSDVEIPYGDPSDVAIVGDWNGDGVDTVGIYRDNAFYLRNSNTAGAADIVVGFGSAGDIPVKGDWNGDGIDTIGVYRPSAGAWFLKNSFTPGSPDVSFTYGLTNETPVTGDWNGDGIDTIGIFRTSDRSWYLRNSNTPGSSDIDAIPYGDPAQDIPVTGDWDGDGIDTFGVYRPAAGAWFLRNSNTPGFADVSFTYGILNEKPVVGDWNGQ